MGLIIIGAIMVGLHLMAIVGAYKSGNPPPQFPTNLKNFELFIWDLVGFLAYNIVLILGTIFLFKGLRKKYSELEVGRMLIIFIIMYLFINFFLSVYVY